MRTGFYREKDKFCDVDFSFLQNVKATPKLNSYTAYDFLHGFCATFAYVLSEKYHYPIVVRGVSDKNQIVHAWCQKDGNYIDIRGITDSFLEFWEEFEDFDDFDLEDDTYNLHTFSSSEEMYSFMNGDREYQSFSPFNLRMARILLNQYDNYYKTVRN